MRPNRDMETIARAQQVLDDTCDLVNVLGPARDVVLLMVPRLDMIKDPELSTAVIRLRAAIEKYVDRPSERTETTP